MYNPKGGEYLQIEKIFAAPSPEIQKKAILRSIKFPYLTDFHLFYVHISIMKLGTNRKKSGIKQEKSGIKQKITKQNPQSMLRYIRESCV